MKNIILAGGKLFLVCAVAATALGFVNEVTEPAIRERKIRELQEALLSLSQGEPVGEAVIADGAGVSAYYAISGGADGVSGYIVDLTGMGYGGDMKILARYSPAGSVEAVRLMDNAETPGLGKKAEKAEYMEKFLGTGSAGYPVPVRKTSLGQEEADSVTGATITFLGVAKALDAGAGFVRSLDGGTR